MAIFWNNREAASLLSPVKSSAVTVLHNFTSARVVGGLTELVVASRSVVRIRSEFAVEASAKQ